MEYVQDNEDIRLAIEQYWEEEKEKSEEEEGVSWDC